MDSQNEISYLLNFNFEDAGATQMIEFMERCNKFLSDMNSIVALSNPLLEKYTTQIGGLTEVAKKLAEATELEGKVSKETLSTMNDLFQKSLQLTKAINEETASKKELIKTTEMLKGEQKGAAEKVELLSKALIKLKLDLDMVNRGMKDGSAEKLTQQIGVLTKQLDFCNKASINLRVELDGLAASNEELGGIITSTKERIKILTSQLDEFVTVEQLASKEAGILKDELAAQNNILNLLNNQISGRLTLERALNDTRNLNIKMQNEINAIEERSVDLKAALIVKENEYKAAVADKVSVIETGYTLEENLILKQLELEDTKAAKIREIGLKQIEDAEAKEMAILQAHINAVNKYEELAAITLEKQKLAIEKEIDAVEVAEMKKQEAHKATLEKQRLNFERAWRDGEDWQAKQAKIAEEAEAKKQAAIEKTTIMYKLQQYVVRDLFRVVAAMLTIIPIMALISFIVDFTKALFGFGEATKKAEQDSINFKNSFIEAAEDIHTKMEIEKEDIKILIQTSQDLNTSYEERVKAVNKVRDAYGDLLDKYSDVQVAESEAQDKIKKADQLRLAADVAKANYDNNLKSIDKNKEAYRKANEEIKLDNAHPFKRAITNPGDQIDQNKAKAQYEKDILEETGNISFYKKNMEETSKSYQDYIHPANNELRIKKFKAELAEQERINESTDYSKYGLTSSSTAADVKKMKDTNGQYKKDTESVIQSITRLKATIAELEGKKDPKGSSRKRRDIEEERATEKERNSKEFDKISYEFDMSPRSDIDRSDKYIAMQKQASAHLEAMEAINKKWEKSNEVSKEVMKKYREEDTKDFVKTNDTLQKEMNRDLMESQKYNEEKLKQIKEIGKKQLEIAEDARRAVEQASNQSSASGRQIKAAKRFNPFQAFFGGGTGSESQDRKDKYSDLTEDYNTKVGNAKISGDKFSDVEIATMKAKRQVDENSSIENPGELQKQKSKADLDIYNTALADQKTAQAKFNTDTVEANKAKSVLELSRLTDKQKDEVKIAEATFNATTKIANAAFDAQQKRIKTQIDNIRGQYALENTLAGNNSAAKVKLAIAEHGKMLELRREEAKSQKAQAIFTATTNAAVAITSALSTSPVWVGIAMAAIVGAAAAYQISTISSAALPSYKKGRRGGRKELANVGEEGLELGEKNGKFRLLGEGVAELHEGETVHTHKETVRWMRDLLKGTGAYIKSDKNDRRERVHVITQSISKKDMKDAFSEALKDQKAPVINLPAQGVQDRLVRVQKRAGIGTF